MSDNEKATFDDVYRKLNRAYNGLEIKMIVDYTEDDMIVTYDNKGVIPGPMFRINKKTGAVSGFSLAEDLAGFCEACEERSKIYKK